MNFRSQLFQDLFRDLPIRSGLANSMLHLLQQAGHAHFHKLVEIARSDGKKFYALENRVRLVIRFFQDSVIELHPGKMPIEDVLRVWYCIAVHRFPEARESTAEVLQPCYGLAVYLTPPGAAAKTTSALGLAPATEATDSAIASCE